MEPSAQGLSSVPFGALLYVCAALRDGGKNRGDHNNNGINVLRGTTRWMRDALDAHAVEGATFASNDSCSEDGFDTKGVAWLAARFPMLKTLNVSARNRRTELTNAPLVLSPPLSNGGAEGVMGALTTLEAHNRVLKSVAALALPPSLMTLDLRGCMGMRGLAGWTWPASLTDVDVSYCDIDDGLMWELTRPLVGLRRLNLAWCRGVTDLSALAALNALTYLDVSGCDVSTLTVPSTIVEVHASHCVSLDDLSPLRAATGLSSLQLTCCTRVTTMADIGAGARLINVDVAYTGLPDLRSLCRFRALETLRATVQTPADEATLASMGTLVDVELLSSSNEDAMSGLCDMSGMTALRALTLCVHKCNWESFASLRGLTRLYLAKHADDAMVARVGAMTALRDLCGLTLNAVKDFGPLAALTALTALRLFFQGSVETPAVDMSPIATLAGLVTLDITGCNRPANLVPLAALSAFTSLFIQTTCDGILTPLAALAGLRLLHVAGERLPALDGDAWIPPETTHLAPLAALTAIKVLVVRDFHGVKALPHGLSTGLRALHLVECTNVHDLTPLKTLTALRRLYVRLCGVTDLTPLGTLTCLTDLAIQDVVAEDARPLAALTGLQHLLLSNALQASDAPQDRLRMGMFGVAEVEAACRGLRKGVCDHTCNCDCRMSVDWRQFY